MRKRVVRAAGLTGAVLGAGLLLGSARARAQTDEERAGARAAATEGAAAFDEKRYAEAVDLMTRAESLVHSPIHLLYIARSREKLGQLVKAREAYLKVTREADTANPAFAKARQDATAELAKLEPRIPQLTVEVDGAAALPVTVTMDGVEVPSALVGIPRPVDPGEHSLEAVAKGKRSETKTITLSEGGRETVVLALADAPGETGAAPAPGGGAPGGEAAAADAGGGGPSGLRIASYASFGVGAVGLGLGTVFALSASAKRKDADDLCNLPGGGCPLDEQEKVNRLDDDADSASGLATAGFIVGGVGVAAGVTLLVLSMGGDEEEAATNASRPALRPWIGLGSAGVAGSF